MGMDNSHINILSDKQARARKGRVMDMNNMTTKELNNDLGVKINFPND